MSEHRSIPAGPTALAEVRHFVRELTATAPLRQSGRDDLTLAVSEAAANSLRHTSSDCLDVRLSIFSDRIVVAVSDQGTFGSRQAAAPPAEGGYGLPLIRAVVDEVDIDPGTPDRPGTTVLLTKRLP